MICLANIQRCIIIGSRKNKIRHKRNEDNQPVIKAYGSLIMYSLAKLMLQRIIVCLVIQLTMNEVCFVNCYDDLQDSLTNYMIHIHKKWNDFEHGWLFVDVIYDTKQRIIVHRTDIIKDLFDKFSSTITCIPSEQFYFSIGHQSFHIENLNKSSLSLEELLITHNTEIVIKDLLLGGARKRDKEEADLTSSEDDELQPSNKRRKTLQTRNVTYDSNGHNHNIHIENETINDESEENYEAYRDFMIVHDAQCSAANTVDYDEIESKYPDEGDVSSSLSLNHRIRIGCNHNHTDEQICYECHTNYNVCSDEELLQNTLLEDNICDALQESDIDDSAESDENIDDGYLINLSNEHINESTTSITSSKRQYYHPHKKRGRKRKKPLLYKNRSRRYNEKICKRKTRRPTYDWDSKEWIAKLYPKKHQSKYKDPKFKMPGGIDSFQSHLSKYKENYIGKMEHECPHCGALLFKSELSDHKTEKWNMCCKNGKIQLAPINTPPRALHHLFTQNDRISKYFQENILMLNSALAMSSSQIFRKELPHSHRRAPPTFILSGAIYHTVPRLLPDSDASPKQAQIYTWDPHEETTNRLNQGFLGKLTREPKFVKLVEELQELLHEYNWVVKMYKNIFETYLDGSTMIPQLKLILHTKVSDRTNLGHYKIFAKPTETSPIATLIEFGDLTDDVPTHRKLVLTTRDNNENRTLLDCHILSDALAFPLLYPYGEPGYDLNYKDSTGKKITMTQYYRYRLLERKNQWNPFIHGQRLFQKFITATWGKIQQNTMNWYINNQKKCRADSYESVCLARQQNSELNNLGKKLNILPRSFVESPRYFRSKYQNAMAILRRMGSIPDFFITFTANSNWREINETMERHDVSLSCRDDIIARVFRAKLKHFLKDITQSNGLGLLTNKCLYFISLYYII